MQIVMQMNNTGVTIKIVHDKRRALIDGSFPIKLRVTFNRNSKFYKVLVGNENASVSISDFQDLMDLNKTVKGKKLALRDGINNRAEEMLKLAQSINPFSFQAFEKEKNGVKISTLKQAFEDKIENAESYKTKKGYGSALRSLTAFRLPTGRVTIGYVKEWMKFMETKGVVTKYGKNKPNSVTTISMYARNLQSVLNAYNVSDGKIFGKSKDGLIVIPKHKPKGGRKALNIEDIRLLRSEKPLNDYEQEAYDLWFFGYYCSGMNMVDIISLKWENIDFEDNTLTFIRHKTKNTKKRDDIEIVVELMEEAIEIIKRRGTKKSKFVFGYITGKEGDKTFYRIKGNLLSRVNNNIRKIGARVGFEWEIVDPKNEHIKKDGRLSYLTSYGSRHSWATVMKRSGVPINLISEQLGHSSIATTEAYLGKETKKARIAANKNLL